MKQTSKTLSILLALLMIFSVTVSAAGGNGGGGNTPLTLDSVKVGDSDLAGAKIPAGSEIALSFSNNVTDSSVLAGNISKITVAGSNGASASATVAPGTDNKVLLVTLGSLSKGAYTLTVAAGVTAKNGNSLAEPVSISFNVNKGDGSGDGTGSGGGNNPLSFVSAKADGKDLSGATVAATGTITITFDRGMTENQADNFAQISILDKDGKKVDGVTFSDFTKDDDGNSFTVLSYKDLAAGDYTLKLGKDLKANNGNTLGKAVTVNFTVKAAESKDDDKVSGITTMINAILNVIKSIFNFFAKLFK